METRNEEKLWFNGTLYCETVAKVELTRPWKRTTMTFEHDILVHESENKFGETHSNLTSMYTHNRHTAVCLACLFVRA